MLDTLWPIYHHCIRLKATDSNALIKSRNATINLIHNFFAILKIIYKILNNF